MRCAFPAPKRGKSQTQQLARAPSVLLAVPGAGGAAEGPLRVLLGVSNKGERAGGQGRWGGVGGIAAMT